MLDYVQVFMGLGITITVINFVVLYACYREAAIAHWECERAAKYLDATRRQVAQSEKLLGETSCNLATLRDTTARAKEPTMLGGLWEP